MVLLKIWQMRHKPLILNGDTSHFRGETPSLFPFKGYHDDDRIFFYEGDIR